MLGLCGDGGTMWEGVFGVVRKGRGNVLGGGGEVVYLFEEDVDRMV